MRAPRSLPPRYFEEMFAGARDPWGFETSAYEQAKYAHTLAALGGRRYRHGLEIGCAIGVLTEKLGRCCDRLTALDVSESALERARDRCRALSHIDFAQMAFPHQAPEAQRFDLIVLSEVAYYWDDADLRLAGERLAALLAPQGDLLLVHWTGETDYPQTADGAVEALKRALSATITVIEQERQPSYRLDLWRGSPA